MLPRDMFQATGGADPGVRGMRFAQLAHLLVHLLPFLGFLPRRRGGKGPYKRFLTSPRLTT
jgi:hypothetical protein